jgi:hypothetical protein
VRSRGTEREVGLLRDLIEAGLSEPAGEWGLWGFGLGRLVGTLRSAWLRVRAERCAGQSAAGPGSPVQLSGAGSAPVVGGPVLVRLPAASMDMGGATDACGARRRRS